MFAQRQALKNNSPGGFVVLHVVPNVSPKDKKNEPQTDFCKARVVFSHVIHKWHAKNTTKPPRWMDLKSTSGLWQSNHMNHFLNRSLGHFKSETFPNFPTLSVVTPVMKIRTARWQFFQEFFDILVALQTHHWYLGWNTQFYRSRERVLVAMYKLLVVRAPYHPTENVKKVHVWGLYR